MQVSTGTSLHTGNASWQAHLGTVSGTKWRNTSHMPGEGWEGGAEGSGRREGLEVVARGGGGNRVGPQLRGWGGKGAGL